MVCFPRRVPQAVAKREDRAVDEAEEEDAVVATAKEDAQKQYQRRDEVFTVVESTGGSYRCL